jgi:NAD(P)H dehydrogenase (quinone)
VFLIPAAESADRVSQHRTAVDAAVEAGVARIVYLSFLNAAPDATFTLARDHWATEERIRASGVAWCFLRMSLYVDFIPSMVGGGTAGGCAPRLRGGGGRGRTLIIWARRARRGSGERRQVREVSAPSPRPR